jgi:hypothetical protein
VIEHTTTLAISNSGKQIVFGISSQTESRHALKRGG